MTSAQLMSPGTARHAALTVLCIALCGFAMPSSCTPKGRLTTPTGLASPVKQTRLWAVIPFANESGVSTVDTYRIADAFTQQLQQVQGIDTIAVNRVVHAMRLAEIQTVGTPTQAIQLMQMLDVDGIVVGTVTAFDPYPPPTLGMAVQVFTRDPGGGQSIDPHALTRAPSGDTVAMGAVGGVHATAQAAGVYDARNHATLARLRQYAAGRTEPDSSFGTDVYLMNIELYTQFVSYWLIHDLLNVERSRLTPVEIASQR